MTTYEINVRGEGDLVYLRAHFFIRNAGRYEFFERLEGSEQNIFTASFREELVEWVRPMNETVQFEPVD